MKLIELYCATANRNKQREFENASKGKITICHLKECNCPETGVSFEENAILKAICYSKTLQPKNTLGCNALVFADDSGLVVDALGGAPGIYSARFAGKDATDKTNNQKLLADLEKYPSVERSARFFCSIALVRDKEVLGTFHGITEGRILHSPRGATGFGYDPLFYYPTLGKTFAEISGTKKWEHSHRGKAFRAMLEMLSGSKAHTSIV